MEFLGVSYTVLCPALPVNGRVVMKGELYVGGVPLHESPMKNHPLTPMWDARIANLMKPQSKYSCVELWKEQMDRPADEIHAMLSDQADTQEHYYVIPDYQDDGGVGADCGAVRDLAVLTGGSGILDRWQSI